MTEAATRRGAAPAAPVTVRPYRPNDHGPCRALWAQMVQEQRRLYADRRAAGDPGAGFEEYLTRLDLSGLWLAESGGEVVGLTGLVMDGRAAQVDPLIVATARHDEGIGRALLDAVAEQARRRHLTHLTVTPPARDGEAIRWYHGAGFTHLAAITLTLDIAGRGRDRQDSGTGGIELHGMPFAY